MNIFRTSIVFSLLALGCGETRVARLHGTHQRTFTPSDYRSVYNKWTRDSREFSFGNMDDVLHVTATFESWEFRWAYVMRYAEDYAIERQEREAILESSLLDADSRHRFFVTMAGSQHRESDLTSDQSAWRVVLINPRGEFTSPVEVLKVRHPGAIERQYFPSVSKQRQTVRLAFPTRRQDGKPTIDPRDAYVTLRFTGASGRVDLKWSFE